jgi:anti-sigma factor RsiW
MNISMHTGPCTDYEHELVELAEGSLGPEKARVVRVHVASCARCRAWQSALADLDARLGEALPRPALSADFTARLESRLAAATRSSGRADLRSSAEDEYRRTLEALRRGTWFSGVVSAMTVAGTCTAGLLLVRGVAPEAASLFAAFAGPGRDAAFSTLGAVVALGALAWSASRGFLPTLRLRG